jgi:hypothetical protein
MTQNKKFFSYLMALALSLSLIQTNAQGSVKISVGSSCKTLNQKINQSGNLYQCIKSGQKLVWSKSATSPSPSPAPTKSTKQSSFITPLAPANTSPITWQNIENRVTDISAVAWQSTQDTLKANNSASQKSTIKVIYAPLTANSHYAGFEDYLRTGIQLWSRFILPPHSTFLVYSFDEIPWAKSAITKVLVDSGMNSKSAAQEGENLSHAPYGGPECGGANAGMMSTTEAIGVFGLCARNEGTDPYYVGPLQIHEFTHQVQGAQYLPSFFKSQTILPCWISEGLAHAGGLSAGTKTLRDYLVVRQRAASHPVLNVAGGHSASEVDPSLVTVDFVKKFYNESAPPGCFQVPEYSLGYSLGLLTTEALSSIGGIESTMLLYSRTAKGETFEQAFKNIYGINWSEASTILSRVIPKEFSAFK